MTGKEELSKLQLNKTAKYMLLMIIILPVLFHMIIHREVKIRNRSSSSNLSLNSEPQLQIPAGLARQLCPNSYELLP